MSINSLSHAINKTCRPDTVGATMLLLCWYWSECS